MPKVPVMNVEGQQVGEVELPDAIFGVEVNEALIHQAVLSHLAKRRRGTHSTKTRGEVSGGGRKPWRQKGTGRARQGSTRAPHWKGGGIVFGPKPRDYGFDLPIRMRRQALRSALSGKVRDDELVVVEDLRLTEPKTKNMARILENLGTPRALVVLPGDDEAVDRAIRLSARNLPGVGVLRPQDLNVYDVVGHPRVVLPKATLARIEEVLGK
ncbi:MAG: 50S ribosomal protein L4 [Limnochordaceae bacterium]|nr:50S ribosomal protein L4 [Limnochordaceae bacterium]